MSMNGIDVSNYQKGINLTKVPCDFVIVKATQGTGYVNPDCNRAYQQAKAAGKLLGTYHYATGAGAVAEADWYLKNIKNYIGESIMVLDWETSNTSAGRNTAFNSVAYAKAFLDRIYQKTGVRPLIYMSKSVCRQFNWSSVAKDYGLWVAQYQNFNKVVGYKSNPWTDSKGYGAWKSPAIFQYSPAGRLSGFNGDLDINIAYIDKAAWNAYAGKKSSTSSTTTAKTEAATTSTAKKSIDEIAAEVKEGKWGDDPERAKKLTAAGYDAAKVQAKVNELMGTTSKKSIDEIAEEVKAGKWGDDPERAKKLTAAGYDADKVQARVNELMGGANKAEYYTVKSGDTLSEIAAKYKTTTKQLQTWNNISNVDKIKAGDKIRVK